MNILYATCFLDVSGVTKLNFDILRQLRHDHAIFIMTTDGRRLSDSWDGLFRESFSEPFALWNYPKKERLEACIHFLKTHAIDVIFTTHSLWVYENCAGIKRRMPSIRIVDSLHVLEPYFLRGGFPDISGNRYVHPFLDSTILISDDLKGYLTRNYPVDPCRLHVVRNGVDRLRFRPDPALKNVWKSGLGLAPDSRLIGFIGRMTIQKRPFLFIEVAKRMVHKDASLFFYMIGSGPMFEEAERLVEHNGLSERVILVPQSDEIPAILNSTDLLLVTSSYEGAPLTIIEALASGVPVVSADVGAVGEYGAGYCTLIKVGRGEAERFTQAAFEVLNTGRQDQMAAITDIGQTARGYQEVFERAMNNGQHGEGWGR